MKFWQIRAAANDPKTGELLLYGVIESTTWWGDEVTPKQFKKDLDALGEIDILNVYINSPGGDVFASQAIRTMLKRHKAKVIVYVDGLAASGASVVTTGGDIVIMPKNAMMMVHNGLLGMRGYYFATELRKMADDLDKINESILVTYQEKTRMEPEKIKELLDAETWMTADEALEYGFIDQIEEEKQVAACLKGGLLVVNGQEMDLSRYKNPPKLALLPEEKPPEPNPDLKPKPEQDKDLLFLLRAQVELKKKKYLGGNPK